MNTRILATSLLAVCAALSLSAQTTIFSDSLASGSANWTSANPPQEGNAVLAFADSKLGYAVATPIVSYSINNTDSLTYMSTLPADSSWSVQVDVHLAPFSLMDHGDFINLNLSVVKASDASNYSSTFAIDRHYEMGSVVTGFQGSIKSGVTPTLLPLIANPTTNATLLISYDATAKTLTYAYDANGSTDGYNFSYAAATNIGSSWSPSGGNFFGIALVGSSGTMFPEASATGPVVTAADAYFTNFAIKTGVAIESTPVPEPSTYATVAGLLALGFACWRRRVARSGT